MAKSMAQIENGTVVNLIWCGENRRETANLITTGDRPVCIGNAYTDGKFLQDGVEITTLLESVLAENKLLRSQLGAMIAEYGLPASLAGILKNKETAL